MDRQFSLYLDVLRFGAALAVVFAHFSQQHVVARPEGPSLDFGREAVIIFFVLSGFVIAWTTSRTASLKEYAAARYARMYSTVIPVLILAYALAALLPVLTGEAVKGAYQLGKLYLYLPLHLLFAGELWGLAEVPPLLGPYWSLGYEVWYYVLFGTVFYLRGRTRLAAAALVLLTMGPKLWLLLPVWLAGVWCFHHQDSLPLSRWQARAGCLLTLALLLVFKFLDLDTALRTLGSNLWPFPSLRLGSADRFLADYAVCALVCLHFLCARRAGLTALLTAEKPIRMLAGHSFTLYLVHMPVIGLWLALYPHYPSSLLDIGLLSLGIAVATALIGNFTEQRKIRVQRRLNVVFGTPGT